MGNSGHTAAMVATIMLIPIGVIFIGFAIHFYRALLSHKFANTKRKFLELENMASQLKSDVPLEVGPVFPNLLPPTEVV